MRETPGSCGQPVPGGCPPPVDTAGSGSCTDGEGEEITNVCLGMRPLPVSEHFPVLEGPS